MPDPKDEFVRHYNVSRETLERLSTYEALLQERGASLSLVGRATLSDIWSRHFLDSAQLAPLMDQSDCIMDIGSGAGFPGMVLAIMGFEYVHLVENNQQKVAFLIEVAEKTRTTVTIHNVKFEAVKDIVPRIVLSRALASLDNLLTLGERFFQSGSTGLFPKGRKAGEEVAEARKHWDFDLETYPSLTSDESSVLRLNRIRRIV